MSEPTITTTSLRTALTMLAFTVIFTGLMAWTFSATKPAIDAAAQAEKMSLINQVLPLTAYDNALLDDFVEVGPTPLLGIDDAGRIYRARKGGAPAGLVIEAIAHDGYSGEIGLLVALRADGAVSGVRVIRHKETPGLGDYIDIRKDKRKDAPWITQFDGHGLHDVPESQWRLKKDGGRFDFVTGATISARAVTHAVARTLAYAAANRDKLYTAASGSRL
ncbi:MAG: electron transport complex subunit RsxG [Candidatus Methylophosphatis roskildensis]